MILDQFDQDVLSAEGKPEDIIFQYYGKKISHNNARKYRSGINLHLKTKRDKIEAGKSELDEKVILGNGQITTKRMMMLSESDSNDPQRIMELSGFDPLKWELVSCKVRRNDWDVTMKLKKHDEHYPHRETNHQYRIDLTIKPIQSILSTDYVVEVFQDLENPTFEKIKYNPGNLMLELPIMDVHLGKLAWGEETGDDYDLQIAERLYKDTVTDILGKVERCNLDIEKIVFPVGQDFFQADNSVSETTAGTRVDTDSRVHKFYRRGVELLIWAVEQLRQIAPVEIMYVSGNHDKILSYCAVVTLSARYENCDSVSVYLLPAPRKYIHYGVNLIGFSHGKEGKRIEHLMQQEQPEAWGNSMYREWHLGDLHHEEAKEVGGIKIRRISSITGTDAWHSEKGFISQRMAQAFVWDKELGRQFVIDSNVIIDN